MRGRAARFRSRRSKAKSLRPHSLPTSHRPRSIRPEQARNKCSATGRKRFLGTCATHLTRRGSRNSPSGIRRNSRPNALSHRDHRLRTRRRDVGGQHGAGHGLFTGRGGLGDVGREDVGVGLGGYAEDLTEVDVGALVVDLKRGMWR